MPEYQPIIEMIAVWIEYNWNVTTYKYILFNYDLAMDLAKSEILFKLSFRIYKLWNYGKVLTHGSKEGGAQVQFNLYPPPILKISEHECNP